MRVDRLWCFKSQGPVLLLWSDAVVSWLATGSAAFIWKLRCHWLRDLRQCQIALVRQARPRTWDWSFSLFLSQVEGIFYVNDHLERLMFDELKQSCRTGGYGGFLPGVKQIANVAALPGIVGVSLWTYRWYSAGQVSPLFIHWRYHSLALVWVRLLTLWWFSARLWYINWLLAGYTLCHSPSIS